MRKAVFLTACDRPNYFERAMNSWKDVRIPTGWDFFLSLEPTPFVDQHINRLSGLSMSSFFEEIIIQEKQWGVLVHPWVGFEDLFQQDYDFIIRAEDDLEVSTDILEYFDWASESYATDDSVGAVLAFTEESGDDSEVERVSDFNSWTWGTWKSTWTEVLRDTWDKDYSTYNGIPLNESGWDWNIKTRVFPSRGIQSISPTASRVQNFGLWGVHGRPENIKISPSFVKDRPVTSYTER